MNVIMERPQRWHSDEVTEKQRMAIQNMARVLRWSGEMPTSKGEASRLIGKFKTDIELLYMAGKRRKILKPNGWKPWRHTEDIDSGWDADDNEDVLDTLECF